MYLEVCTLEAGTAREALGCSRLCCPIGFLAWCWLAVHRAMLTLSWMLSCCLALPAGAAPARSASLSPGLFPTPEPDLAPAVVSVPQGCPIGHSPALGAVESQHFHWFPPLCTGIGIGTGCSHVEKAGAAPSSYRDALCCQRCWQVPSIQCLFMKTLF